MGLNAGWDSSSANLTTLRRHLDEALAIYADVITNPSFPDKEFARLTTTRMGTFRQRRDNPEQIADLVSGTLLSSPLERQFLLETMDLESRLKHLIHFLMAEIRRQGKDTNP